MRQFHRLCFGLVERKLDNSLVFHVMSEISDRELSAVREVRPVLGIIKREHLLEDDLSGPSGGKNWLNLHPESPAGVAISQKCPKFGR